MQSAIGSIASYSVNLSNALCKLLSNASFMLCKQKKLHNDFEEIDFEQINQ